MRSHAGKIAISLGLTAVLLYFFFRGLDARELKASVGAAYHLAAVYDLAVARALGLEVNVVGTRHVVEFLAECPRHLVIVERAQRSPSGKPDYEWARRMATAGEAAG